MRQGDDCPYSGALHLNIGELALLM